MKYCLLLALLVLDVVSKAGALVWVPPMEMGQGYPFGGIGIFSNFFGVTCSLNFLVNTGTAWGLFPGHPGLLFGLRAVVIGGLLYYLISHRMMPGIFPLWFVATGAIGNAIDYILYGQVIDFIHFTFFGYSFPVFNFADSYISISIVCLFFVSHFRKQPKIV